MNQSHQNNYNDMHFSGEIMNPEIDPSAARSKTKSSHKCLTGSQKRAMLVYLQLNSENGKLYKGAVREACERFACQKDQVYTLWTKAKKVDVNNAQDFEAFMKSLSPRKKKCGRKMISLAVDRMKSIPTNQRGSLWSMEAMFINHSYDCVINLNTGICDCKPMAGHPNLHYTLN